MLLNIRELTCEARFIIIPLDDFDFILGHVFMRRDKVDLVPDLECFSFLSQDIFCRCDKPSQGYRSWIRKRI